MKEWEPRVPMISYGPKFLLDSFFDRWVVLKNLALTNTLLPTWNGGASSLCQLAPFWYHSCASVMLCFSSSWISSRWATNHWASIEGTIAVMSADRLGW